MIQNHISPSLRAGATIAMCAVLATGCGKSAEPGVSQAAPAKDSLPIASMTPAEACAAITDWPDERIPMPPEWAPGLPEGYELLRFSPGMYKPESDDYFSYAFALMWKDPTPPDLEQLTGILDQYYRGLTKAVAEAKKLRIPADDVSVKVTGRAPNYRATVNMYEPFVTGQRITLEMDLILGVSCLNARASPRPRDHPVWQRLATAAACLPCP